MKLRQMFVGLGETKNSARLTSTDFSGRYCLLVVLFGVFAIGVFPIFSHVHESSVIIGADVLQRLLVLAVFVAGVVEKGLNDLTAVIFLAVCAGDVAFRQAAFLHPAFGPTQIPGAIQIPLLTALAGLLKFTAGLAVGATATDFLCAIHREEFLSVQ